MELKLFSIEENLYSEDNQLSSTKFKKKITNLDRKLNQFEIDSNKLNQIETNFIGNVIKKLCTE